MALSEADVRQYREEGYVLVRSVFDAQQVASLRQGFDHLEQLVRQPALPLHFWERQYNPSKDGRNAPRVYVHIQPPSGEELAVGTEAAVQHLRKVQWPAYTHEAFEAVRTSPVWPALLAPLFGDATSLKQYINQVNFKKPGGNITFPLHQDVRDGAVDTPLQTYVQTYTLVDDATENNGCLYVVPKSQAFGNLGRVALQQRLADEGVDLDKGLGGVVACTGKAVSTGAAPPPQLDFQGLI